MKPYTKKMEFLDDVWDGSARKVAEGYSLTQVIAVETGGRDIIPLYANLYSNKARDFISGNDQWKEAMDTVSEAVSGRGIWVINRGADRGIIFDDLLEKNSDFIIRLKGNRHLLWINTKKEARQLALTSPLHGARFLVRIENGQEYSRRIDYGFRSVRLPKHPDKELFLVTVKGVDGETMILLTNIPLTRSRKCLESIIVSYITRCRIEETFRYIKQSYELEDIRVMAYSRLENMIVMVNALALFVAVVLGTKIKIQILTSHLIEASIKTLWNSRYETLRYSRWNRKNLSAVS